MPELYHVLKMISAGNMGDARQELAAVLKRDPNHLEAWSLMALAVTAPAQKADCYRRVLALDPENENARYQLAAMEKLLNPPSAPAAPAGSPPGDFSPAAYDPLAAVSPAATPPTEAISLEASPVQPPVAPIDRLIQTATPPQPPPPPAPRLSDLPPETLVAAFTDTVPPQVAAASMDPNVAPQALQVGESCSQQVGYLGIGFVVMGLIGMPFACLSAIIPESVGYSTLPENDPIMMGFNVLAGLVVIPIMVYLAHKGWDTPDMNPALKFLFLFFVAIPTPFGWYWMGRGASRLIDGWMKRYRQGQKQTTVRNKATSPRQGYSLGSPRPISCGRTPRESE